VNIQRPLENEKTENEATADAHIAEGLVKVQVGVLSKAMGYLLCFFGMHDFKIVDVTVSFGSAGGTETVQCRRCSQVITRSN
jgi:hypothetical protein